MNEWKETCLIDRMIRTMSGPLTWVKSLRWSLTVESNQCKWKQNILLNKLQKQCFTSRHNGKITTIFSWAWLRTQTRGNCGYIAYLYQEMVGSGEPEALQDNVISSPLSAVALKDFWGIVIAGGTERQMNIDKERWTFQQYHWDIFTITFAVVVYTKL